MLYTCPVPNMTYNVFSGTLNLTQPTCPSIQSHSMPASLTELKNPFHTWIEPMSARVLSPSGWQTLWPINRGLAH